MSDTKQNDDVFNDEPATTSETEITTEEVADDQGTELKAETEGTKGSEQQGEQDAESPAADGDTTVQEKMIPETRFKAALKDVTSKWEAAERKLAELSAVPVPDRATDPDGYDRHIRIETSKAIMSETFADYDDMIEHFQEMATSNPELNTIVGNHKLPAKMAYDLAKKDKEIRELSEMKNSDDWKQFQEWKKSKTVQPAQTTTATQLVKKTQENVTLKVPNLNRTTNASPNRNIRKSNDTDTEDDLFKGAL